jgi:hypothetical protein
MKKLLIVSNIILLTVTIFMYSCIKRINGSQLPVSYNSCYNCGTDTFAGITYGEFRYGIARYKTTHYDLVNQDTYMKSINDSDARSCWYSLNTLKRFICLIEKYTSKLVANPDSLDLGIRFYYSVYPDSIQPGIDSFNIVNKSHHTLFLVPTYYDSANSANIDFDPRDSISPLNFSFVNADNFVGFILAGQPIRALISSNSNGNSSTGATQNQGQLCPPTCPTTVGNTLALIDNSLSNIGYTTPDN